MKIPVRLLTVLLLGGAVLYSMAGFKKTVEENYLRNIQTKTSTETQFDATRNSAFAWQTKTLSEACQLVPPQWQHASALALWTESLGPIHKASQMASKDPDYEFHDLTAQLLHLISPRLPHSVKAIPRDWTSIGHVLEDVLVPRWNYIMGATTTNGGHTHAQHQEPPRPVKIVVMGGSVVSGVNCLQIFSKKVQHTISRQQCAWPFRLQNFLDRMVANSSGISGEQRLFEVHTVVMGGSNTVSTHSGFE